MNDNIQNVTVVELKKFHIFSHQTHHLRPVFRVEPCSDWMNNVPFPSWSSTCLDIQLDY